MPSESASSLSAAERADRSLARFNRCRVSASLALRAAVSASAFLSPRCGMRSDTLEPRSPLNHAVICSGSGGSAGTRISRGTAELASPASASSPARAP